MIPLTDAELAEMKRLEREATQRSSKCWIAGSAREDGTAQVYSPSLGPLREIVPIAETTTEDAALIVALRNAAPALLSAARDAALLRTQLVDAHREMMLARAGWSESVHRETGLREQVRVLREALRFAETQLWHDLDCPAAKEDGKCSVVNCDGGEAAKRIEDALVATEPAK